MSRQCIEVAGGPPAVGPYSPAVVAGGMVYISGQIPMRADGAIEHGTVDQEARLVFRNLETVLKAAGCGLNDVVKVTAYLVEMRDFAAFNDVYKEVFPSEFPARTCIQAARLPKDVKVEVDAIAVVPS